MNRYIAFLRGINISGKNKVPMAELKTAFETAGYSQVSTYLNSGNVIFSAESDSVPEIRNRLEELIAATFQISVPVYVIRMEALQKIMAHAPDWWGTEDKGTYHNLIFILSDTTPDEICTLLGEPSAGMERVQVFENVIFWSFDRAQYQKCAWWKKTAAPGIAEQLTIRTAGTVKKVLGKSSSYLPSKSA